MNETEDKNFMSNVIDGFIKFQENDQLKRAKEMRVYFEQLNIPTLEFVQELCRQILVEKIKELDG